MNGLSIVKIGPTHESRTTNWGRDAEGRRWVLLRDFDPDHLKTFNTKLDEAAALPGRCVENEPVAALVQDKIPAAARLSSPSTPDIVEAD